MLAGYNLFQDDFKAPAGRRATGAARAQARVPPSARLRLRSQPGNPARERRRSTRSRSRCPGSRRSRTTRTRPATGDLQPGPVGEYLEVVDVDPASDCFYAPVDLNDPHLLAQDGLPPSRGQPAVPPADGLRGGDDHHPQLRAGPGPAGALVAATTIEDDDGIWEPRYVRRLRIYPHALRRGQRLLQPAEEGAAVRLLPGQAIRPGASAAGRHGLHLPVARHHRRTRPRTRCSTACTGGSSSPRNPDSLAFHEAFADIVALFQHFSFPEVLRHQIAKTRGDLARQNLLGELAHEFGQATGGRGALRNAIGTSSRRRPAGSRTSRNPGSTRRTTQPHARGAHPGRRGVRRLPGHLQDRASRTCCASPPAAPACCPRGSSIPTW